MNGIVHYTSCPVCNSTSIHPLLTVKDESVSGEQFVIWQCEQCSLRFTQDVPDETSIGPYYKSPDYISHTNINKGLLNKLYQGVRNFTLNQKANLLIHTTGLKQGSMLDVGCGIGAFINVMKNKGWQVEGAEPDEDARRLAKELFQLSIKQPSALFDFRPSSFDAISLWHVLEHVHDLHNYVEQLKTLLKENGQLFIAVPNYQSLDSEIYRLKWAAYDVPRHLYHFTPQAIQVLMKQHGMKVTAKKPMWFDSFYISLLSSKYRNGYTNWLGAAISGLRSNLKALMNKDRCSSLIYIITKNTD
ncbi:class I SAM-dependent methyltransferase [Chitinophagaceae bacterium LB-8]|uniref:Class I SAM-dependent methyltransferase n=1 Tax=Paraflavisolibacter caeni TaxID=2982496 RepID=A0A9X2XWP9_9BACT|nr:class I SAM-dependent methyltransferase [Paraflavisolibacter caeni]MCU7550804.1 class I SAM-dependent methyltransferase [Paraflavisolibacter caeni]